MSTLESAFDLDHEEETREVPGCIESLASSVAQLQQLARHIGEYYIPNLITYGYVFERTANSPGTYGGGDFSGATLRKKSATTREDNQDSDINKLNANQQALESMNSLLKMLPLLNEITSQVERAFSTVEVALRRSTYYMNKAATKVAGELESDLFQLPIETKLHPIFIAMMDLSYALVSLDETISSHTKISQNLNSFKAVCKMIIDCETSKLPADLANLPMSKLKDLMDFITNIQLSLCNESCPIFNQCIDHLLNLGLSLPSEKTREGYNQLREQLEEFIRFYAKNLIEPEKTRENLLSESNTIASLRARTMYLMDMNLVSTLYMNSPSRRIFGLLALSIVYFQIFKRPDKRVARALVQVLQAHKCINLQHLLGSDCYIMLDEFLVKNLPKALFDTKVLGQLNVHNSSLLRLELNQEFSRFTLKVIPWLVRFKNLSTRSVPQDSEGLKAMSVLFQQGIRLIEEINYLVKSVYSIYSRRGKDSMTKDNVRHLLRLVALLKSIEHILKQNRHFVHGYILHSEELAQSRLSKLVGSVGKRLVSMRSSNQKVDINSALAIISLCNLSSGPTILALSVSMLIPLLNAEEVLELNRILTSWAVQVEDQVALSANCGYLFWQSNSFTAYYNYAFEEAPCLIDELHYLHLALDEIRGLFVPKSIPTSMVDCTWITEKREAYLKKVFCNLMDQFKADCLDKLCQELEMELRLQTHRDLHPDSPNPFRRHLFNFKHIFAPSKMNRLFRIADEVVSLRLYVEDHLNRFCYNFTAVSPNEWFSYDSMINLARHRYSLECTNLQLPTQTLEHGIDLLDMTRNLAQFVSRYGYDLTNQLFVEKSSNRLSSSSSVVSLGASSMFSSSFGPAVNQSLNVVQISHIAKSIQTHGYGVLNSSVNRTYQVMKRIVNLFSKQISDEKLRSVLAKEYQLLVGTRDKQQTMSFDRANKMAKRFRMNFIANSAIAEGENNTMPTGTTGVDLDSLRQSITQLGNSLAFIRILKSGALNCASKSVDYLPDLDDLSGLRLSRFLAQGDLQQTNSSSAGEMSAGLDEATDWLSSRPLLQAAQNFDQCLIDFHENFSPKTNYFSIIISLFKGILSDNAPSKADQANEEGPQASLNPDRTGHLRFFFLLVPALTIHYIDYLINCKERLSSRSSAARLGGLISDDGFSMGVAFLLTVLGQSEQFASFQWFRLVRVKIQEDRAEVERRMGDSKYEESLKQTGSMTLRRLGKLCLEYEALDYTLSSALLFFRSSAI